MAASILEVAVGIDPLGDFRFDGRREHRLSALAKNLEERVSARGWKRDRGCGNFLHGGVLLGESGPRSSKFKPKYAAFFNSSSTTSDATAESLPSNGVGEDFCQFHC
jgi:hypothetical protein